MTKKKLDYSNAIAVLKTLEIKIPPRIYQALSEAQSQDEEAKRADGKYKEFQEWYKSENGERWKGKKEDLYMCDEWSDYETYLYENQE
jgi:hypothetical protein